MAISVEAIHRLGHCLHENLLSLSVEVEVPALVGLAAIRLLRFRSPMLRQRHGCLVLAALVATSLIALYGCRRPEVEAPTGISGGAAAGSDIADEALSPDAVPGFVVPGRLRDRSEGETARRGAPDLTGQFLGHDAASRTILVRVRDRSDREPGEASREALPPEKRLRRNGDTEIEVDGKLGRLDALGAGCTLKLWLSRGSADLLSAVEATGPRLLRLSAVVGVDPEDRTIRLRLGLLAEAVETRPVAADARILINGLPARLAEVSPWRPTYLEISADMKTVVAIHQSMFAKGVDGLPTFYPRLPHPAYDEDLEAKALTFIRACQNP